MHFVVCRKFGPFVALFGSVVPEGTVLWRTTDSDTDRGRGGPGAA